MADLQTIDTLEGGLSPSHIQQIRAAVIAEGDSLEQYQAVLQVEAIGSTAQFSIQIQQHPGTGQLHLQTNSGHTCSISRHFSPDFCNHSGVTTEGVIEGDRARQIWEIAQQYAE